MSASGETQTAAPALTWCTETSLRASISLAGSVSLSLRLTVPQTASVPGLLLWHQLNLQSLRRSAGGLLVLVVVAGRGESDRRVPLAAPGDLGLGAHSRGLHCRARL